MRIAGDCNCISSFDSVPGPADIHLLHHQRSGSEFGTPMLDVSVGVLDVEVKLGMRVGEGELRDGARQRDGFVGLICDRSSVVGKGGRAADNSHDQTIHQVFSHARILRKPNPHRLYRSAG